MSLPLTEDAKNAQQYVQAGTALGAESELHTACGRGAAAACASASITSRSGQERKHWVR